MLTSRHRLPVDLLDVDRLLRATDPEGRRIPTPDTDAARLAEVQTVIDRRRAAAQRSPLGRSAGRRLRTRLMVGTPVVGLVASAAIVVSMAGIHLGNNGGSAEPSRPISGVVAVEPATAAGAPELLQRIATAALSQPVLVPTRNQFVYVRSEVAFTSPTQAQTFDGRAQLKAVHERQIWLAQDPNATGVIREGGGDETLHSAGADSTRYADLQKLPTDPAQLLKLINSDTAGRAGGPEYAAFDWIGEVLRESIIPPQVNAALYRAAALIPGVVVVPDAVDAVGRHGIGIALVNAGERYEWIFNPTTYTYLGERDYLVEDTTAGPAGMLTGLSAVLERGVADHTGQIPDANHIIR
ncbi:MAG: hypothetical protein JWO67_666 [Streptosporangiaceae bacterium]|nr:hypothetical protein [Streptosporangiaceae bacterium]